MVSCSFRKFYPLGITLLICNLFKINDLTKLQKNDDVNDDVNYQKN